MNRIKLYTISVALALAACAGGLSPTTPQQTIYTVTSDYTAAATVVLAYKALPVCPAATALCKDPAIVQKLRDADTIAYNALVAAENTARTPGAGANAATALVAANQAIAAFTAITATLSVK
jgi:hypothetical protein